jgi:Arm DNA-binding domain
LWTDLWTDNIGKLAPRKIESAKPGKYGDGGGLRFVVTPSGGRKWVLRFLSQGKARDGFGQLSRSRARRGVRKALAGRRLVRGGVDPIAERRKDRGIPTFGEFADEIAGQLAEGFRNEKHKAQRRVT